MKSSPGTKNKPVLTQNLPPFPLGLVSDSVRPYIELIRLHKPTGVIIIFWPFAWGLTMAAYRVKLDLTTYWKELAKCIIAAFIVRSSACTINDIFDREYDARVERTKGRPLPSGRMSVTAALIYLSVQYIAGITLYLSYDSVTAFYAAMMQLFPLFLVYPLMKRITNWPQAWLGIAMGSGIVISWAAITDVIDIQLLGVLMIGLTGWTLHYDTIYACQDRKDDIVVGVKSTAVMLGDYVYPFTAACAILFISTLYRAGQLNEQSPIFFIVSVGGSAVHLLYQYSKVDIDSPDSCARIFVQNGHMGLITWVGMMLDYLHTIDYLPFNLTALISPSVQV